ncbi:MAG: hypothetical protein IJQ83_00845 [Bacteroidales bacterium]|nr:hypothetical protein [Bacteroidales bacterium]
MKAKRIIKSGTLILFLCSIMNLQTYAQNEAPEGALKHLFSVNNSKKVFFSKGNLQYQASTNTWRFAEKQTDVVGKGNENISENYSGWIDLFSWGTSGYRHGSVCYQPWSTSKSDNDYCANGQIANDLSGKADWGYNAISNGGNTENQWRTLSEKEWTYLLNERKTSSGIRFVYGKIGECGGMIILPDDWDIAFCDLDNPNGGGSKKTLINQFSEEEWNLLLEAHGAVFLPFGGIREGAKWSFPSRGDYWSATRGKSTHWSNNPNNIVFLSFGGGGASIASFAGQRFYGRSVRLVHNAK